MYTIYRAWWCCVHHPLTLVCWSLPLPSSSTHTGVDYDLYAVNTMRGHVKDTHKPYVISYHLSLLLKPTINTKSNTCTNNIEVTCNHPEQVQHNTIQYQKPTFVCNAVALKHCARNRDGTLVSRCHYCTNVSDYVLRDMARSLQCADNRWRTKSVIWAQKSVW